MHHPCSQAEQPQLTMEQAPYRGPGGWARAGRHCSATHLGSGNVAATRPPGSRCGCWHSTWRCSGRGQRSGVAGYEVSTWSRAGPTESRRNGAEGHPQQRLPVGLPSPPGKAENPKSHAGPGSGVGCHDAGIREVQTQGCAATPELRGARPGLWRFTQRAFSSFRYRGRPPGWCQRRGEGPSSEPET